MTRNKLHGKLLSHKNWKKVLKTPKKGKLLYHYTSLEVLWRCLENDTLYARNVRFSNDAEEYDFGKKIINQFCRKKRLDTFEMGQCFMVCFCLKDDLLSQWRGYASEGISIGFDFSYGKFKDRTFTHNTTFHYLNVLNNEKYQLEEKDFLVNQYCLDDKKTECEKQCSKKEIDYQAKYFVDGINHGVIASPYRVSYAKKKKVTKELNKIYTKYEDKRGMEEALYEFIPYIKNRKFSEEQEYRLLISLNELMSGSLPEKEALWAKKVFFLQGKKGEKLPNIEISFGEADKQKKPCRYVFVEKEINHQYYDFVEELKLKFKKMEIKVCIINKKAASKQIIVGIGNNQSEISMQIEMLMEKHQIKRDGSELKVWYQGHLPIRTITVAPGPNMQRIKESIQYYLNTIYWLKYVEVKESKIPFRT